MYDSFSRAQKMWNQFLEPGAKLREPGPLSPPAAEQPVGSSCPANVIIGIVFSEKAQSVVRDSFLVESMESPDPSSCVNYCVVGFTDVARCSFQILDQEPRLARPLLSVDPIEGWSGSVQRTEDFTVDGGLVGDSSSMTVGLVKVAGSVFAKNAERSILREVTRDDLAGKGALEPVRLPG